MSDPKITIDEKELSFCAGETILDVAKRNSIAIPTLCHLAGSTPTGACRMCVVEVEKARNLVVACAAPAGNGMVVRTESPRVVESRRRSLELLLASGNHDCNTDRDPADWQGYESGSDDTEGLCPVHGECKLQEYAYRYRVSADRFKKTETPHKTETVNPFIVRDFSRCIQCGRCVQACNDLQVNNAISYGYRGKRSKIVAAGDKALADSDCVFCGECVQACPVGALVEKDARYKARPWNTRKIRTTCSYCGVGCQLYLHVKGSEILKVTGVENAAPNFGSLCVKGRFGYDFINSPDRLTHPLIKKNGGFEKASWGEALDLVADKLGSIKQENGGNSLAVFASARITNEENYIAQKFSRAVLKTNNVDHCARLCHASTVAGLAASFGSGAMTNPIRDCENSDVLLITGSNPTENHPVMSMYMKRTIQSGRTKLIVVDPRDIGISRFADLKLSQKPGSDVAWISGMMHVIIKEDLYDKKFVAKRTEDFEAFKKEVEGFTPEKVEKLSGIKAKDIIAAARLYAQASAASIIYAMGITQHHTGTDNVKSLANLAMLCGNMGIPGGGVNPLRGQNNVQGACDMGSLPNVYSGYQKVTDPAAREKMAKAWGTDVPEAPGKTIVEIMNAAEAGEMKGVYIIGENPMLSDPDLNHTEECLKKLDFLVVQDIFLTETAQLADVVLPSVCFAEKDGTFTNTERKVLRVRKAIQGPGEARQDWDITSDIARRMGYNMSYGSAEDIMKEIAQNTPSYGGISYPRIEEDGIPWPCPGPDHPGTPILHVGTFSRGQGKFHAVKYIAPAETTDRDYPLILTTGRILYQYHTGTMSMKSEGLNERAPESFVEINFADAQANGIVDGSMVTIASRRGKITCRAHVSDKMMPGTVFIPFHYVRAAANRLTHAALDPVCKIPELKVCAVKLAKAADKPLKQKKWGQLDIRQNTKQVADDFVALLRDEGKPETKEQIDAILREFRPKRGAIIPVLQRVQNILAYLPPVTQIYIAQGLTIPAADVYGIVSFYSFFTQKPRGKHLIKICMGTACYVMGSGKISDALQKKLNIGLGETTEDRKFTLEAVRCIGACGLAPVMTVGEDVHRKLDVHSAEEAIDQYD